jgi:hypothetical protein
MSDQPTVRPDSSKKPDPADVAPTQIAGTTPTGDSSPKTAPAEGGAGWAPFDRSSIRFGAQPSVGPPPEACADETVVMELADSAHLPLAWLAVVDGPGAKRGKVVTLTAETVVGRTQGDLLLVGDHGISSQHLRIRLEPQEGCAGALAFVAYDQATTNGTYVGGRDSYREESARAFRRVLADGDYLLLGETTLVFKQIEE